MKYYLKTERKIIPDILDRDIEHIFVRDKITSNDTLYTPWIEVNKDIYNLASKMLDPSSDFYNVPDADIELEFVDGKPFGCSIGISRYYWENEEEREKDKQRIIEHEAELREKGEL